ncbi:DUF5994 family protein [Amycolatopsis sp. cg9]|uniref:DUF5994 family protein n=1 Tax=Amycolatopsis sp. cg9 TaxID=3238801 RepID=UPI0035253F12
MPSGPNTSSPKSEPRLGINSAKPATGPFDGAWWPASRDLATELPALLDAMTARVGQIDRVTYHLADWPVPDRRLPFGDGVVRLEGFRSQAAGSLTVIGWNRNRMTLRVVPPETEPGTAKRTLAEAAAEGTPAPAPTTPPTGGVRERSTPSALPH